MKAAAIFALVALVASTSAQVAPGPAPACLTVAQTAADAELTTLLAAVDAAGLTATLSNPSLAYTVFAPTNEAFDEALEALNITASQLLASPSLKPILQNHLLAYPLTSFDLITAGTVTTEDRSAKLNITAVTTGNDTIVEVATPVVTGNVVLADVSACSSIVHVVDTVLVPAA